MDGGLLRMRASRSPPVMPIMTAHRAMTCADMMNMSFDDLRNEVASPARTVAAHGMTQGAMGRSVLGFSGMGSAMGGLPSLMMGADAPSSGQAVIPDHRKELEVYLFGPGADKFTQSADVSRIDQRSAMAACKGKRDFILFEPLDNAAQAGQRLVIVTPMAASPMQQAQVYLASSLSSWLSEQKVDGSGRPYGETKDEDPTLRKHFTRSQIIAILDFGQED